MLESIISFLSLSFTKIFCRFSGIFIEKTTFEEFVEISEQKQNMKLYIVEAFYMSQMNPNKKILNSACSVQPPIHC